MMMKRTDSAYTSSQGPHHSLSAAVLKIEVEQNLNKIICFTDRQEELTKEVTAAFERGRCFVKYSAAINIGYKCLRKNIFSY